MIIGIVIAIAVIAFDMGLLFGAWWASRERQEDTYDQEVINKEITRRLMRGE